MSRGTRIVIPVDEQRVREIVQGYGSTSRQGCVCPPTSEKTCRADHCPRQPAKPLIAYSSTLSTEQGL